MASLQAQVDVVKTAVTSPSTCTAATAATLKRLILPESAEKTATTTTKTATRPATKQTSRAKPKNASTTESPLSSKDRTALATTIVNSTIKILSDAAKPQPPATPAKRPTPGDAPPSSAKRALQRSLSTPMSPLQPRTLNRVATSPSVSEKSGSSTSSTSSQATKYLATAECAHLALACLRASKGPLKADQTDFQVENGMSTLAAKLVAIGLNENARRELTTLKRRLEHGTDDELNAAKATSSACELLEYRAIISPNSLSVVAACQIQSLKLIAACKKPAHIEAALPFLRDSNPYSPTNILVKLSKTDKANSPKAARQLASVSQTLLSLAPSVSSSEDHVATEPRLSPSPAVAFELQALAFKAQLSWWKMAGHQGKIDDDILSPFSRCVRCFLRRQPQDDETTYSVLAAAFNDIMGMIRLQNYEPSPSPTAPLATLYHLLGSASHSCRQYNEACRWYGTLRNLSESDRADSARSCSVSARLLAASLKLTELGTAEDRDLVQQVIEGLNTSLTGTAAEINELHDSLSLARRSVVGLLMNNWGEKSTISPDFKELLKTFVLRYPRFVLRWLGSPPGKDASTKHILQFDQRRQLVMQSIFAVLDGAFTVVKSNISPDGFEWQPLDEVIQPCTILLKNLHDPASSSSTMEKLGTYHVKISNLCFTAFSHLRKRMGQSKADRKQALQALNRSIDIVKDRSAPEKEKAQLSTKLEILADLCKGAGRPEDASKTLRSICTNMVEEGVLAKVAAALATRPPRAAWGEDDKALSLSRTLRSIAKLDDSWNDWTFFLPEAERAAVLEHLLQINTEETSQNKPLRLHDPGMAALLRIYTPERYPIRRLRVLLRLFSQQLGNREGMADITNLLDQSLRYLQKKDLAEDNSLAQFIPHLRIYHSSMTSLGKMDGPFPVSAIQEAIASWTTMVDGCESEGSLLTKIDEPETLLDHLLASDRLAGLKGETRLQVSILELSLKLAKVYTGPTSDDLMSYHCKLASQYIDVGMFAEASQALSTVKDMIRDNGQDVAPATMVDFYLSQAQYLTGMEDTKEAMAYLDKASSISNSASGRSKTQTTLLLAQTSLVQSKVQIRTGDICGALSSARLSLRWLSQDWNRLEGPSMQSAAQPEPTLAESVLGPGHSKRAPEPVFGPRLWSLARPLFDSLVNISVVCAHIGMYQETAHYCESAETIADGTGSPLLKTEASAWAAYVYAKAQMVEKALAKATEAERNIPKETCAARVKLLMRLGETYQFLGDDDKSNEYFKTAEETTQLLNHSDVQEAPKPKAVAASRRAATTRTTKAKVAPAKTQKRTTTRSKPASNDLGSTPKDPYQASLMASVLLSRAISAIRLRDWDSVASTLEAVQNLPKMFGAPLQQQLITASHYLGMSVEQMVQDPVFSVMHDSTISFPTVLSNADKGGRDRPSLGKSPPRRGRAVTVDRRSSRDVPAFAEALNHAQEVLIDAQASALATGDSAILHRISTLLQNTAISLTAASSPKIRMAIQNESTSVAVEVARNAIWKRERLTIEAVNHYDDQQTTSQVPSGTSTPDITEQMANLGLTSDMARFQDEFIELVPGNWSVVSISLSDNKHDLCITKFQAGHSPFILRLPLERANSRDADSDVFNFQHGREELLDIISNANRTSHSAAGLTTKASRNAWWAERQSLDERLKELLSNMETTWLGGFKGIFSQHTRQPDLLARFQKNFHQLLERSLPSRSSGRGNKGRSKPASITLDPRILDLFIGLGDPTDPDCDFDEALNDLLYFVVDILQFNGERNAYDEIDFDAMVVETYDALRGYHAAAAGEREAGAHTVLVLDKALHGFPWESMPCLENLAVSRVPSLAALQRLITEAKMPMQTEDDQLPGGHYVSAKTGTYMLNPSSDLTNTQSFFSKGFTSHLSSWTSLVNKEPTEREFEKTLSSADVFLYFGHGGGSQYIRGRSIRRLERCRPATFLMGCSSAALSYAGEFECHGPVWNYMMAGCPAVVGTLWDVTDRDIDRFAGRAFEEWGLVPRGTFVDKTPSRAGEQQQRQGGEEDDEGASLAEAVMRARAACRFKYLNAAAVVMYGIPVYIGGEE